jgi:hypothetical protein
MVITDEVNKEVLETDYMVVTFFRNGTQYKFLTNKQTNQNVLHKCILVKQDFDMHTY